MKFRYVFMTCSSLILLSACATTTPSVTEAGPISSTASTLPSTPETAPSKGVSADPNAQMAKLIVTRDYITPILFKTYIEIDGEKIGRLKNTQYLETYIEPGDHVLAVKFSKLTFSRGTRNNISVAAGETYAWELDSSLGLSIAGVQNIRLKQFDPEKNPFKISDLEKVETKK